MSIAEKLTTIAENMAKLQLATKSWFDKGRKQQEIDFWNTLQSNGNRKNYDYAFAGTTWTNKILNPPYAMQPSSSMRMFLNSGYIGDLRDISPNKSLFDFSKSTSTESLFGYATQLTKVGVIDISSSNTISGMFTNCSALIEIEKLVFKNDGSQTPGTSIFQKCYALQNIVIGGVIGNSISFGDSKSLTKDSIVSIINALKDDASGQTLTLSQTAKNNAFSTYVTAEWTDLVASKSNWTISLV